MFEDNPLEPSPFVFDSHDFSTLAELDSFFNFNSSSSSSRQTSPAIPAIAEPQPDLNDLWFDFSNIQDDINSPKPVPSKSNADSPWDFFTFPHDSPGSGTTSTSGGLSPSFAIDPQLMVTPATSKAASDFGDDDSAKDEHGPEEEDDEDDEGPVTPPPARPGNKTKDRKHVVHSGGVQKKVHISAVVKTDPFDNTLDDWRPTPDEYQKMSSKEKRQLRNKISARNFRNRRKEYITTLECDVAERDRLIDAIRAELGSTKSENAALQQEIKALKKTLLASAGRASSPVLPPPGPLPISAPPSASRNVASTSSLLTPNTHKDLPSTTSPRLAAKAFWGGSSSTFGGITPVHTVTIPDLVASAAFKPTLQENINPALNATSSVNSIGLSTLGAAGKPAPFDTFTDANPFTMKMLDAYRMQLWTRMSQQQQQQPQQPASPSPSPSPLTGLAAGLRPRYFSSASSVRSPLASSLLSGKHTVPSSASASMWSAASAYPTPPSSPKLGSTSTSASPPPSPTPQHAALATMASQTLIQRLGSSFWQAFSGTSSAPHHPRLHPTSSSGAMASMPAWDADKVRRVLEGTAVVRVVDVELPPTPAAQGSKTREANEVQTQAQPACAKLCSCARARETGLGVLEESMRALTLGKK